MDARSLDTCHSRMARFDALPQAVRKAIAGSGFPFHPQVAEVMLRRGVAPARCAENLRAVDTRISLRQGGAA